MGKIATAECHDCFKRFPKTDMVKEKRKSGSSGTSFSFGRSGMKGMRVNSGRDYYRYAWICDNCYGGSVSGFFGNIFSFLFKILAIIFIVLVAASFLGLI